ncbi:DegT/DnrJ/EryC1/StrS family aminotransferase [bacterium]|nr:DegT/DnrJ/EryC1/StrS family aminotransferase [bacterium]
MNIPLIDLQGQYEQIKDEIEPIILEIMRSQRLILGTYNSLLEESIKDICKVKYAVSVASGTDALLLALKAANLPAGSEVITTAYSFFASTSTILMAGLKPVFVDIDPQTYNLDPDHVEKAINKNTRGILPVHLYGQSADMNKIMTLAKKKDLVVIEDLAQSILAEKNDTMVGTFGLAGTLSFYPSKNLGAFGDAGMVLTNNTEIFDRISMLHVHGSKDRYIHEYIGYNSRMDEMQAAVLYVKLKYLKSWTQKKREAAFYYNHLFNKTNVKTPFVSPDCFHVFNSYVIEVDKRNELREFLTKKGISTAVYYPLPLPFQPCFKFLGHSKGDFPCSEKAAEHTLAIPCFAEITKDQQEYIAENILDFLK